MDDYTDTTGSLARDSGVTVPTVKKYADLQLLDFRRAANGMRLFKEGQAKKVREIMQARLANRGRRVG